MNKIFGSYSENMTCSWTCQLEIESKTRHIIVKKRRQDGIELTFATSLINFFTWAANAFFSFASLAY